MVFRVPGIHRLTVAKGRPKVKDFLFEQFHGFGTVFNKSGFQHFGPHHQQLKQFRVVQNVGKDVQGRCRHHVGVVAGFDEQGPVASKERQTGDAGDDGGGQRVHGFLFETVQFGQDSALIQRLVPPTTPGASPPTIFCWRPARFILLVVVAVNLRKLVEE